MMSFEEPLAIHEGIRGTHGMHPINRFRLMYGLELFNIDQDYPGWHSAINGYQLKHILLSESCPSIEEMKALNNGWPEKNLSLPLERNELV